MQAVGNVPVPVAADAAVGIVAAVAGSAVAAARVGTAALVMPGNDAAVLRPPQGQPSLPFHVVVAAGVGGVAGCCGDMQLLLQSHALRTPQLWEKLWPGAVEYIGRHHGPDADADAVVAVVLGAAGAHLATAAAYQLLCPHYRHGNAADAADAADAAVGAVGAVGGGFASAASGTADSAQPVHVHQNSLRTHQPPLVQPPNRCWQYYWLWCSSAPAGPAQRRMFPDNCMHKKMRAKGPEKQV